LQKVRPGEAGEIQLTDGIQLLVETGKKVVAVRLAVSDSRLDIGNPESYWEALQESFRASQEMISIGKN
jgi:UTP-glucose-1-phosphate uridylyltransferase